MGRKAGVKLNQLPEDIVRHGIGQFLNPDDIHALSLGSRELYKKAGAPLKDATETLAAIPLDLKEFEETMYKIKNGTLYNPKLLDSPKFMIGLAERLRNTMYDEDVHEIYSFDENFPRKTYVLVDCAGPHVLGDARFVYNMLSACNPQSKKTIDLLLKTMGTNLFSNDWLMGFICSYNLIRYFLKSCAIARDVNFMVKKLDDNDFAEDLTSLGPENLRKGLKGNPIVLDKRFMTKALERLGKKYVLALLDREKSPLAKDCDFLWLLMDARN